MKIVPLILSAYHNSSMKDMTDESIKSDINIKVSTSIILSITSLLLSVFNVANHSSFMLVTTVILTVGFAACAVICGVFRKRELTVFIMSVLIGVMFTVYAIIGGNDGFAILWMLFVPLIGMSLIGLRAGTVLSAYFQFFLIAFFYTPLRQYAPECYTVTFCNRFPVLYLTSFATAMLLASQKEYYFRQTRRMAMRDAMTDLYNRRYFETVKEHVTENDMLSQVTLLSIDINGLKAINDSLGHVAGDELITGAADSMRTAFPDAEALCRIGGDEFTVVTFAPDKTIDKQIAVLQKAAASVKGQYIHGVSLSVGRASVKLFPVASIDELEKRADEAMYVEKSAYYEAHGLQKRF